MQPSINVWKISVACPIFCLLKVWVCLNEATLWLNLALDSVDTGRDPFREHWDHSLVVQDSIKHLESWLCIHVQNAYPSPPHG